ncbi:MAG: hypothetical protein R3C59_26215 [Planctomycetaceae bacterium]
MPKKWGRERDDAGSMLATVIVIVLGTLLCCFLCLLSPSDFSNWMLALLPATALLMIFLIARYRYGRGEVGSLAFWNAFARSPPDDGIAAQYRPRKIRHRSSATTIGGLEPITAQEAHELRITSANTWVPSRTVKPRKDAME